MMIAAIDGKVYRIGWVHWNPLNPLTKDAPVPGTECTIASNPVETLDGKLSWTVMAVGNSFLCYLDRARYNKETGRKISFARAIAGFDRETRKLFWDWYLNRGLRHKTLSVAETQFMAPPAPSEDPQAASQ